MNDSQQSNINMLVLAWITTISDCLLRIPLAIVFIFLSPNHNDDLALETRTRCCYSRGCYAGFFLPVEGEYYMKQFDVEIRAAAESEWDQVWNLLERRGATDAKELAESRFLSIFQNRQHYLPIAAVDQKLVGYGWVQNYGPHLRSGQQLFRLHDLFVLEPYRKNRIAAALFESMKEWSQHNGASWLQWNANPTSTSFYMRLGYQPIPEEDEGFPFFEIEFAAK
ncbi:GNAT family N-acetyltransferase [Paenibacillus sp. MER TA 81-3]|uniref:GNAT family N-acetyltransferase n=1 Tax=Paenibacillus sp. MER TA 81-3 TaxID=2939573 RepID=UPI002040E67C|nr:GNAT family N-acetyltransferase [Paenibacillus sp. MER TA 81-3]